MQGAGNIEEFKITEVVNIIIADILENGCIRDKQSAVEIITSMFKSVYDKDFSHDLPLIMSFDDAKQNNTVTRKYAWRLKIYHHEKASIINVCIPIRIMTNRKLENIGLQL